MKPEERQKLILKRASEFDKTFESVKLKCGETKTCVFTYQEDPDQLESYKISCRSCTTVDKQGGQFAITFKAPQKQDYQLKIDKGIKEDKYTSNVLVYFKDNLPMNLVDSSGELKPNPDKVSVSLEIRATIEFE